MSRSEKVPGYWRRGDLPDSALMTAFEAGEQRWIDRFGDLRNVVRQELIARQLAAAIDRPGSVLDVGCGQGEQARRLLSAGWAVTGVDPSEKLLDSFRCACRETDATPELFVGRLENIDDLLGTRSFDLVCAHGLLMYLDDRKQAIRDLADRVAPGGLMSVTFRNAHGLAMRPGLRQAWPAALEAFDSPSYVNELGVPATADHLDSVDADLIAAGMSRTAWYGVRVFTDSLPAETPLPEDPLVLAQMLDAEQRACSQDPYRWLAAQLHVIARRSTS